MSAQQDQPQIVNGPQMWTIGHWTCPEAQFIEPLQKNGIELLVDVRSQPGSRRSPQFDRDQMPRWLTAANIDYLHLAELGGRRPRQREIDPMINAGWQNRSFKNYADYTLTDAYHQSIVQLTELALEHNLTLMCGEPMPWRCHRLLIANTLTVQNWTIWHLMGNQEPRRHELGSWGATPAVDDDGEVTYPLGLTRP